MLTDSVQFIKIYSECTNISVGYQNEHTFSELQDIDHLEKLAVACTKVDWNSLPVERDPSKVEYRSYGGGWDWEDDYSYGNRFKDYNNNAYGYGSRGYGRNWSSFDSQTTTKKKENEKIWFMDNTYNHVSKVEIDGYTKKYVSVDLSKERIKFEKILIDKLLRQLDLVYESSTWDGFTLNVNYGSNNFQNHTSNCDRNDLVDYLPELDYKKLTGDLDNTNFKSDEYNEYCDGFYD